MAELSYIGCPFCGQLLSFEEIEGKTDPYLLKCRSCRQMFSYLPESVPNSYPTIDVDLLSVNEPHTAPVDEPNVVESFVNESIAEILDEPVG